MIADRDGDAYQSQKFAGEKRKVSTLDANDRIGAIISAAHLMMTPMRDCEKLQEIF